MRRGRKWVTSHFRHKTSHFRFDVTLPAFEEVFLSTSKMWRFSLNLVQMWQFCHIVTSFSWIRRFGLEQTRVWKPCLFVNLARCWVAGAGFLDLFICLFVGIYLFVLFIGIKPEKLYSACWFGREVNPLGVSTHGQRHKPHAYQRQRHRPHTCQSTVNTLQVDGLARITGLSGSHSTTHSQPPIGIPPCLVWRIGFGRGER